MTGAVIGGRASTGVNYMLGWVAKAAGIEDAQRQETSSIEERGVASTGSLTCDVVMEGITAKKLNKKGIPRR